MKKNKALYRSYMITHIRKKIKGLCCCWNNINGLDINKAVHVYRAQRSFQVNWKNPEDYKKLSFENCNIERRLSAFKARKWKTSST